jgi:hypothetical protein
MVSWSEGYAPRRSIVRGRIIGPVDYVYVDFGTGGIRMGCSNEGDEECREIGNYPNAEAGTPSLVPQAPSDIIYELTDEGAQAVGFGYDRPRASRRQRAASKVKIALLPDPESYDYVYSLLVDTRDVLGLSSVQQIPEDFLRLAINHATRECNGQPKKGWVFSVPQSYGIDDVHNLRAILQTAGCRGEVYIHGESDCVTYANLPSIEHFMSSEIGLVFKKCGDFSMAAAILDLGAGTTVVNTPLMLSHD